MSIQSLFLVIINNAAIKFSVDDASQETTRVFTLFIVF